jgi:hypothetical protein
MGAFACSFAAVENTEGVGGAHAVSDTEFSVMGGASHGEFGNDPLDSTGKKSHYRCSGPGNVAVSDSLPKKTRSW